MVDNWWGRPVLPHLPRLFLDLFWSTSLIAESTIAGPAGSAPAMKAFLVGVLSPSDPGEAYVHFLGVEPAARGAGVGRTLYETFLGRAAADGHRVVRAITSPGNAASIAFHRRLGFTVTGPVPGHNGPGTSYVLFERHLGG